MTNRNSLSSTKAKSPNLAKGSQYSSRDKGHHQRKSHFSSPVSPKIDYLIIRLSSLGDIIHTLPAFGALRRNFPAARLGWLVEKKGADILDWVDGLDQVFIFPSPPSKRIITPFTPRFFNFLRQVRQLVKPQGITIDFQGLLKSATLSFLSGAKKRLGFNRNNLREPQAAWFYTQTLPPLDNEGHVIDKNLKLLQLLDIEEKEKEFPLLVEETVVNKVKNIISELDFRPGQLLVVANIGGAWPTKRWPVSHWTALLKPITRNHRFFPLLLWGTPEEENEARLVSHQTGIKLLPFLTIKEVMALISTAHLVISGDSFPLQVASAFKVPVIGLFGPTDPHRNGPWHSASRVAVTPLDCRYCYARHCREANCMAAISPTQVSQLTEDLIKEVYGS